MSLVDDRYYSTNRDRLIRDALRRYHSGGWERVLELKYGLPRGGYQALLDLQGGVCAICERLPGRRRFHVDHDHDTNEVRGLLCDPCNTWLSVVENLDYLERASAYLGAPPARDLVLGLGEQLTLL